MIRVYKHNQIPESLSKGTSWAGEDVIEQLSADQNGKCYLCERIQITDFQVEHHKSRINFPALTFDWSNLFWVCNYCNGKKLSFFDDLLNPAENNIEDLIHQYFDFPNAKVVFSSTDTPSPQVANTITLLTRIFNGTNRMRTKREQRFYDYSISKITSFQKLVADWLNDNSKEIEEAIIEELNIKVEFLGFKYWIIRSNESLLKTFGKYISWNRR